MRTVAILVASGPSNLRANDLPPEVELWSMNMCHRFLKRPAQRWFQMHHRNHNMPSGYLADTQQGPVGYFGRPKDHEEWLQACGIPVYMQEVDTLIPTSVRYPIEDVARRFGSYFTSTVAYMIALALHEGVDEILLLGIYLKTGPEYEKERPCVEYFLGAARALGVRVVLPEGCDLTRAPLYAYSEFQDETLELESVEVLG